jgi:hypothetical protein
VLQVGSETDQLPLLERAGHTIARKTARRDPAKRLTYQLLCSIHTSSKRTIKVTH